LVNEGTEEYRGRIKVPSRGICHIYNAWHNRLEPIDSSPDGTGTSLFVRIEPRKSFAVVFGETADWPVYEMPAFMGAGIPITGWKRSLCASIDYPTFGPACPVAIPDSLAEERPGFSGFARYEARFYLEYQKPVMLEITNAAEGLEIFVNGVSAGIQIILPYCYDLSGMVQKGENRLVIEVATTLERERSVNMTNPTEKAIAGEPSCGSGITGTVFLKYE
jgi:hypothetical protein